MTTLLADDEPPPFRVLRQSGTSPFLLTADHAGRVIPRALGRLGLGEADLDRHIAWDIGIAGVTERLAAALDATAVLQTYSRLVIDCNRQPSVPSAFPEVSEATVIPGNAALPAAEKQRRQREIFDPYHAQIARLIAARGPGQTIYVAMHSFTPVYLGAARPMQAALLYNRNPRLSDILARLFRSEYDLAVAENDPYLISVESDNSVPDHA